MKRKPQIYGHEFQIESVRYAPRRARAVLLPLTVIQREFLLYHLSDITKAAELIFHHPKPELFLSPWSRSQVTERIASFVRVFRGGAQTLIIITPLDREIIVQAMERSHYFAEMRDDDPRLTCAAVKDVNQLREEVRRVLQTPLARLQLGAGRRRIKD